MKAFKLIFFLFLFPKLIFSQKETSNVIIKDLTSRIMNQIDNLQEYITLIAKEEDVTLVKSAKGYALHIFTEDAIIEEGSKFHNNKTKYKPAEYLDKINSRREIAPRIIEFETIDELLPEELEKVINSDGSITYKGSMTFKQYYCKLKPIEQRVEVKGDNQNINCSYSDNTEKKVYVEIRKETSVKGEMWITKISRIEVIRVYG